MRKHRADTIAVDFFYPRQKPTKYLTVGLSDVRAADDIRISYDFERDGWKVEQGFVIEIDSGTYIDATNVTWEEVGFFPAWNLEHKGNNKRPE